MIDFEYYKLNYKGTVIPDEQTFNSVLIDATAFVDSNVSHREKLSNDYVMSAYNNAICAVAENIHEQNNGEGRKSSESVGNHSVSYAVESTTERQTRKFDIIRLYLANTGLLYRGG